MKKRRGGRWGRMPANFIARSGRWRQANEPWAQAFFVTWSKVEMIGTRDTSPGAVTDRCWLIAPSWRLQRSGSMSESRKRDVVAQAYWGIAVNGFNSFSGRARLVQWSVRRVLPCNWLRRSDRYLQNGGKEVLCRRRRKEKESGQKNERLIFFMLNCKCSYMCVSGNPVGFTKRL